MPSRTLIVVIVIFWLGSMAWLVRRDVWPRLVSGEPPPLRPDYLASSGTVRFPTRWSATLQGPRQDKPLEYSIITTVSARPAEDTVDLDATVEPASRDLHELKVYRLVKASSRYRVTGEGHVVQFRAKARFKVETLGEQETEFTGDVADRVCTLKWERGSAVQPGRGAVSVEVSHVGLVLLPLHPVTRLRDLKPGRAWGVYLLDPLDRAGLIDEPRLRWVHAEVRAQPHPLLWHHRERSCLVIDYRSDDGEVGGSTWVDPEQVDLVLRQEMRLGDETWTITRKDPP